MWDGDTGVASYCFGFWVKMLRWLRLLLNSVSVTQYLFMNLINVKKVLKICSLGCLSSVRVPTILFNRESAPLTTKLQCKTNGWKTIPYHVFNTIYLRKIWSFFQQHLYFQKTCKGPFEDPKEWINLFFLSKMKHFFCFRI